MKTKPTHQHKKLFSFIFKLNRGLLQSTVKNSIDDFNHFLADGYSFSISFETKFINFVFDNDNETYISKFQLHSLPPSWKEQLAIIIINTAIRYNSKISFENVPNKPQAIKVILTEPIELENKELFESTFSPLLQLLHR